MAQRLKNAAALVKLLTLAPSHRLHREQVTGILWPDSGRRAASNNLRMTLYTVRRVLNLDAGPYYLAPEDKSLVIHLWGELWVDVETFERRLQLPVTRQAGKAARLLPCVWAVCSTVLSN